MPDLYLPMSDAYTPRRTVEEIVALYKHRVDAMGPVHAQMRRIREAVNGDIVVPLNELDRNAKVDAANLMLQGLDQMGMRVSSVMPGVWFPPMSESERHKKVARDKKNAILSMWDEARMPMKVRRRARHMLGYSSTPVMVCPDFKKMTVKWRVINPIDLFPAERDDVDDPVPDDTIRVFSMPYATALRRYPQMVGLRLDRRKVADPACRVNVLEYQDGYEVTQIAMGDRENPMVAQVGSAEGVRLAWAPNRAGRPLVVCPERIVMDRARGAYDDMLGMFYSRARLQALNLIAVEKGIFPNEWLVARPGEDPQIIQEADGRLGQVGIVSGGDIRTENLNPGYKTDTAIDRIERQERNSGGIPAEFGGECVDPDTEILTADGWKRYDEVGVGTEVLTLNHETALAEWQPIQKMNVFEAEKRTMLEAHGSRHSSLSTLNHRWPVVRRNGNRVWRFSTELSSEDRIPIAAMNGDVPVDAKWSDALVETVAWYWTEGTNRQSGGAIAQSAKRPANVDRIRAALTALFGAPTERFRDVNGAGQGGVGHDGVPRWRETKPNHNMVVNFILSKHAVEELERHAPGKVVSFDWLRQLTQAQLDLFINVSLLADNCGSSRLGQKDPARTEAFAFAVILSGRGVSYSHRARTDKRPDWPDHEAHIARVRVRQYVRPKENHLRGTSSFRQVEYDGIVWCPTTPNGTWLARRNGSVYFTGNSTSNIRTGRRGDSVLSATVDFRVQEAQALLADSLKAENEIAIAVELGYWGDAPRSFHIPGKAKDGDYTPSKLWEVTKHFVTYSMPGADVNNLVVGLGQRVGTGLMSKETARESDPLIADPDLEHDRITREGLEAALFASIQAQANDPAGPYQPADLAYLTKLVMEEGKTLYQAIEDTQRRAQERQAAAVPEGAPEAMPGMSPPGMGMEQPTIGPPDESVSNLAQMMGQLRRPAAVAEAMA